MVTKTMPVTVKSITMVSSQEVCSIPTKTTTMVTREDAHWGMDWEIICRRVSMSLV